LQWDTWTRDSETNNDNDDDGSTEEDDVDVLARRLCDRLSGAEARMGQFREWLSVTHEIAESLSKQRDDAPA
jgi:hypothetical protein